MATKSKIMSEFRISDLRPKLILKFIQPIIRKVQNLIQETYSNEASDEFNASINLLYDLLSQLLEELKNRQVLQNMEKEMEFTLEFQEMMTVFENDLHKQVQTIRGLNNPINRDLVFKFCGNVIQSWLKLLSMWQTLQIKEIKVLIRKIKGNLAWFQNIKDEKQFLKKYKELCEDILSFKKSVSNDIFQLYDSNSVKKRLLFANIFKLLEAFSETATLKYKYSGVSNDPKYLESLKFYENSIIFYVNQVAVLMDIDNDTSTEVTDLVPDFIEAIDAIGEEFLIENSEVNHINLAKQLTNLHAFGSELAKFTIPILSKRIIESIDRFIVYREELLKDNTSVIEFELLAELVTIEKLVDMAILRSFLDIVVTSYDEENDLMRNVIRKVKENSHSNVDFNPSFQKLRNFVKRFCSVIELFLKCTSSFQTVKWGLALSLKWLTSVNEALINCLREYVQNPMNIVIIHELKFLKHEWDKIIEVVINNVMGLISTPELLKLIDSGVKNLIGELEDITANETEIKKCKNDVQKVLTLSKIAVRVLETFSTTKSGFNARKAIQLANGQVNCCLKTVNLFKTTYFENLACKEVQRDMFNYLINLSKEIEKLSELYEKITTSNIYNQETRSQEDTQSGKVETKTEFTLTDILLEELSARVENHETLDQNTFSSAIDNLCSVFSEPVDSEVSTCLDSLSKSLNLKETESDNDFEIERLSAQLQTLREQLQSSYDGEKYLLDLIVEVDDFIYQVLSADEHYNILISKPLMKSLNNAICKTNDMKLLIRLSALQAHLKYFEEKRESCDANILLTKLAIIFKELVATVYEAESVKLIEGHERERIYIRRIMRQVGLNVTIGLCGSEENLGQK